MVGANRIMKFRRDRKTDTQPEQLHLPKKAPKRWWDSALVGIAMSVMFATIVLKLTGLLPELVNLVSSWLPAINI
jgi:hypothetical protein